MSGVTPLFILMESHYGSQRRRQRAMNQLLCYEIKIELPAIPGPYPSWEAEMGGGLGDGCRPGVGSTQSERGQLRAGSERAASEGNNSCLHLVHQLSSPNRISPGGWGGKLCLKGKDSFAGSSKAT